MNKQLTAVLAATLISIAASSVAVAADNMMMKPDAAAVMRMTASWPADSKKAIKAMTDKYGPPHEATASMVVWHKTGPWKRTIVYREEVDHQFPMPHKDVMQQFIDYRVQPDRFDDLAMYDGSVVVDRTQGEISARCDKEEANFLALNLAHEVATGKRSVQDARKFYAEAIKASMEGRMSPYMQKLQFSAPQVKTADADMPFTSTGGTAGSGTGSGMGSGMGDSNTDSTPRAPR